MTLEAVAELLEVGDVVGVPSRAVRCSHCEEPTESPVFMGVSADGLRLPVWWCERCSARFEATS
jgi:hypothetical protein